MRRRGVAILTAVVAVEALVGCSGPHHQALAVRSPSASTQPVFHEVHSPGRVTDDEHLIAQSCTARSAADGDPLPDPRCTPGAIDPAVTQATITATICVKGWTATVRPPASDTGRWKVALESAYAVPAQFTGELDHLIPLELGGANSISNLWPESGAIPNAKDTGPERHLHDAVCAGRMTLRQAQIEIAADWTKATW